MEKENKFYIVKFLLAFCSKTLLTASYDARFFSKLILPTLSLLKLTIFLISKSQDYFNHFFIFLFAITRKAFLSSFKMFTQSYKYHPMIFRPTLSFPSTPLTKQFRIFCKVGRYILFDIFDLT